MAELPVGSGLDSEQRFGVAEGVGGEEGASRQEAWHTTSLGQQSLHIRRRTSPWGHAVVTSRERSPYLR